MTGVQRGMDVSARIGRTAGECVSAVRERAARGLISQCARVEGPATDLFEVWAMLGLEGTETVQNALRRRAAVGGSPGYLNPGGGPAAAPRDVVLAAIANGARTVKDIAGATGMTPDAVRSIVRRETRAERLVAERRLEGTAHHYRLADDARRAAS